MAEYYSNINPAQAGYVYGDPGAIYTSPQAQALGWGTRISGVPTGNVNLSSLNRSAVGSSNYGAGTGSGSSMGGGIDFSFGNLKNTLGNWWDRATTVMGQGDNATTPLQLGTQLGLGAWGIYNQNKNFKKQLEAARQQFEFNKGYSQANFMNQGTNYINQGLFQLEGLNAFNPNAGAERAQNFNAGVDQMNAAGARIGLGNNAFQPQQNQLAKYNTLAGAK